MILAWKLDQLLDDPGRLDAMRARRAGVAAQVYQPTAQNQERARALADPKDVPIPVAAIGAGAPFLVTHNVRHFRSGEGVRVVRPRTLIEEARAWMATFGR